MSNPNTNRRDFLKAGAAAGGLAAFAVGFSETGTRAAQSWFGDKKTNGVHGRSLEPEMRIGADGKLELNPNQQISYAMCLGCTTQCGVRVRIDKAAQTVVRVAGNPYSPLSADPHLPMGTPVRKSFQHLSRLEEKGLAGRSTACGRGNAVLEQMTSPFRITQPLKRVGPRNSGKWEPISFEQLVKEVVFGGQLFAGEAAVKGLADLRSFDPVDPESPELGPKVNQVALLSSVNDGREAFMKRFMQKAYGTMNVVGHGSYCGGSYRSGSGAAFGDTKKMPHAKPDLENAEFVIFVGTAPANAGNPFKRQGTLLAKARTEGKLNYVVVDPVLTHADNMIAEDRSRWIPIIPGTDGALAMAMIRWIIENERFDATFLAQPNLKVAEAAGEAAWCNATHLVVAEPGHSRNGFLLRGSDMGLPVPEADKYKEADPFVVIDQANGAPVIHTKATGPAILFVDQAIEVGGQPVRVRSSLDLLRESAASRSLADYSAACGIPVDIIEGLAREFTSHGKKAAINSHGGTMAGNGFYNAFALVTLNTLIGNLNRKGGTIINAGGFKEEEGPRYQLAEFDGAVKFGGTFLGRNMPYEKSSEFKRKKETGRPYPAAQPWYATAPQLATEWLHSALTRYPYGLEALILWSTNPVYGIPGIRPLADKTLGDPKVIPLLVAIDCFINETSAYADYIVPDGFMYECWGFTATWAGVPTKSYLARWPVVEPKMTKTADGQPASMESFFIAAAKAMGLPGYGDNAGTDADANPFPIHRAEDYYLRAAANLAFTGKKPVGDASDDDIMLTNVTRILPELLKTLKEDEIRKVAFLYTRGGRFQPAKEAWDVENEHPEWATWRFNKPLQVYNETVGASKDAMTGKRFSGVPIWTQPRFADGTPVRKVYTEQEWPLQLISYKSPLQNSYSISASRLRGLHPDNPVAINPADAERLGVETGDEIVIATPGGSAKAVAVVRHGVRQGVLAVEHGFGHRELGARAHWIGNDRQPVVPANGAGLALNDLGLIDPTRKTPAVFVDPVSGTAVRQGLPAKVAKA